MSRDGKRWGDVNQFILVSRVYPKVDASQGTEMTEDLRREERERCHVRAKVKARGQTYHGWVHDVSAKGMRISTDEVAEIWTGDEIEVDIEGFGVILGTARWRVPGRAGILLHDMLYDSGDEGSRSAALGKFLQNA